MAQYFASIHGAKGEATRLGNKQSGLTARVNAWHIGARVDLSYDDAGRDVLQVWLTSGSENSAKSILVMEIAWPEDQEFDAFLAKVLNMAKGLKEYDQEG